MKKTSLLAGALALALTGTMASAALTGNAANGASVYKIEVNGRDSGAQASVMVPLRTLAESLGFRVTWQNGAALVDDGTMHTEVTIGQNLYFVTTSVEDAVGMSAPFSLGAAPYVTNGVTYVPVELFRALLGNGADTVTADGAVIRIRTEGGTTDSKAEGEQIANPFTDCETLSQAAAAAGFSLSVPDSLTVTSAQAMAGELLQVQCQSGQTALTLRKAPGTADCSGDYNAYDEQITASVGTAQVTLKGEAGTVRAAVWTADGYAYAVSVDGAGLDAAAMRTLVQAIR